MYVVGCSVLILGKASAAIIQFGEDLVLIHGFADGKILWSDVVDLSRMFFPWIVGTLLVMLVFWSAVGYIFWSKNYKRR
ncbi:hypothetical protein N9D38_08045 [Rubripirellula sp.]|jgi:hypothetical protein|nr:hypothetical protein [Rubripirellula sp.]